jgi:hypothetical protein
VYHLITNFAGRHRSEIDAMKERMAAQGKAREMLAIGVLEQNRPRNPWPCD